MARVLMFGRLADTAGWRERTIDVASVGSLKALLTADEPELARELDGPTVMVVINDALVRSDAALRDGDEIGFLPPVSGG